MVAPAEAVPELKALNSTERTLLAGEVEQFLFDDAELLDQWRLHEWLALFTAGGRYLVPSTDKPDGDPSRDLFLVQDDRFLLEQRVNSLLTRAAHAEYPHSRTRRLITNVRVRETVDARVHADANFAIYRTRSGTLDTYIGHYRHLLERDESGSLRYLIRKSVLDLDALRPQGKVSIIL
jgi:p-cumate 2,3-dioxygenase subunit beta